MPRSGSPAYYALLVALAGLPLTALIYAGLDPVVNNVVSNTSYMSSSDNAKWIVTGQRRILDIWITLPLALLVSFVFAGILVSRSEL